MVDDVLNVKPKARDVVVVVLVDAEESVDVDVESEVVGKEESVGMGMVPMVLAASLFREEAVELPDAAVVAAQSVADTVVVDTTVTVTMLFVPTTTVGVTIPFVSEEVVVVEEVSALDVVLEEELDVEVRVGSEDVEVDEDVKI